MNLLKAFAVAAVATLVLVACAEPSTSQVPAKDTAVAGAQVPAPVDTGDMVTVKTMNDATLGTILVDAKGMTLYRFTKDQGNMSSCYDACAKAWPPLTIGSGEPTLASGVPGVLSTTDRTDGTRQVSYNGAPLYYYVKDAMAGDTTGEGVNGVWFVVKPSDVP